MKKEKRLSVILPKYNEEHPSGSSLKAPWFMEFLPDGIVSLDTVNSKKNATLFKTFAQIEKQVNATFEEKVKKEFADYYVEALADEEIIRCLPHKPVSVKWDELDAQEKKDVVFIYKEGKSKGYVESTIRKHIKRYFSKKFKE